jgi:hypothetical protein
VVGCAARITEHMLPVLEAMLHQFPFRARSRANRRQENAPVEGKNTAVIRKHIGHGRIGAGHAGTVHNFHTAYLNPDLNFHRPCGFATVSLDARGKRRTRYKREDSASHSSTLSASRTASHLPEKNTSFAQLAQMAGKMSDTEWVRKLVAAKAQMLRRCKTESPRACR